MTQGSMSGAGSGHLSVGQQEAEDKGASPCVPDGIWQPGVGGASLKTALPGVLCDV